MLMVFATKFNCAVMNVKIQNQIYYFIMRFSILKEPISVRK